jgi:hypothetical protein
VLAHQDPRSGVFRKQDPWQRFLRFIEPEDAAACWRWKGSKCRDGYGKFHDGARHMKAQNYAYREMIGPIPEGLQLDHLCRVRDCVNPYHLEPVTILENVRRGENAERNRTACPSGHPYDKIIKTNGKRRCRTCDRAAWLRWYTKSRGGDIRQCHSK